MPFGIGINKARSSFQLSISESAQITLTEHELPDGSFCAVLGIHTCKPGDPASYVFLQVSLNKHQAEQLSSLLGLVASSIG